MFWTVVAIAEAVVLLVLVIILLSSSLSHRTIMKKAALIVKGKLDVEDIKVIGQKRSSSSVMASAFNSIKTNLLTFIEETKSNVVTLSDATETLSKSVITNQSGNEQIAEGVTTVVGKVSEQLDLVKNNLDVIEANNAQMQEIDQAAAKIKSYLDETVEVSQTGLQNLERYEKDIVAVSDELEKSNLLLTQFNESIKEIKGVSDLIISINNQLRLLAINASIEAARAGQVGKGFEVVAQEMKAMSDRTDSGMETIAKIVDEVIVNSELVNGSINNCEHTFGQGNETFREVSNSFQKINERAFEIHGGIKDISEKIDGISRNLDESKIQAERLFDASELISNSTHEIAAASEETAAESTHISKNVDSLSGMLVGIQNLLKQFNTAVVPVSNEYGKKVKIAFLSMLDNDFWYGVRRGAFYAQKELNGTGAIVDYLPFYTVGAERDEQVKEQIRECIKQNVDGIILPGFLDGGNEFLKQATERGIKVIAFNCDCAPDIDRLACFSPNSREAGALAAEAMEKALGRRAKIAVMTGPLSIGVNRDRRDSFLKKLGGGIRVVENISVEDDADDVYRKTVACLESRQDIDCIYITTGMVVSVAKAIEDLGLDGQVSVVGFDHSQEIFSYIKKDIIAAAIGQDPFGQGHDPIIWMYNHLVSGEELPKEFMSCRLSVVNKENVENLIEA